MQNQNLNDRFNFNQTEPQTRYWQSAPKQTKPPKRPPQTDNTPDNKLHSQVKWAIGLEVASHYGLQKEYQSRAGYAIDGYDLTFWGWIKHHRQIDLDECESLIGWLNFRTECIDRSGIRPSMFDLNTQHITNSGFGRYEVLETLNIPINRFFEQNENRPGLKFGGELYAFVSTRTGFFNAKPRTPQWDATKCKDRKYESARKIEGQEGNKVFYPDVDQIACDLLMQNFPICTNVTPANFWDVTIANPGVASSTTEGVKKAVSLTGYGFPCVAVFGVCNWSVSGSSPRQLLPELATLAKGGRSMPIAYDMDDPDEKIVAFLNGRAEARKYRAALVEAGADPQLTRGLFWDRKLGKGHIAGRKDQSVQIKVPSASFREAMTKIEAIGGVVNRSVTADDVSEEFHDLEVRLGNLRGTRTRLQEFLGKANGIQDMLTVERELERVALEIDRIEGRLEFLRTRASMSVISVALTPKPKVVPIVVVTPPPPPPRHVAVDLPIPWVGEVGIDPLLSLRK